MVAGITVSDSTDSFDFLFVCLKFLLNLLFKQEILPEGLGNKEHVLFFIACLNAMKCQTNTFFSQDKKNSSHGMRKIYKAKIENLLVFIQMLNISHKILHEQY